MGRLLFLLAIVAAAYLLMRSSRRSEPSRKWSVEDMVRCVHCGVHLPRGESFQFEERLFCSMEHRDASRR